MSSGGFTSISLAGNWECGACGANGNGWYDEDDGLVLHDENWQRYGKRPTGLRFAAMWTVLSAENIGWLLTHPVQGWHAWKHRNDPPPPRSPAVEIRRVNREEPRP